jgi:hypothetical protein
LESDHGLRTADPCATFPQPFRHSFRLSMITAADKAAAARPQARSTEARSHTVTPLWPLPLFTFSEKERRREHLVTHPGPFQKEKSYRQATDATPLQAYCVGLPPVSRRVQLLVARQVHHRTLNVRGQRMATCVGCVWAALRHGAMATARSTEQRV